MIVVKIDVSKISKEDLFQGKKGTYLDIILWETPDNEYGNDYVARQGISKERSDAGVKGEILGNAECKGTTPKINNGGGGAPADNTPSADESLPF